MIGYSNAGSTGVPHPVIVNFGGSEEVYPSPPSITFTAFTPKTVLKIGSI